MCAWSLSPQEQHLFRYDSSHSLFTWHATVTLSQAFVRLAGALECNQALKCGHYRLKQHNLVVDEALRHFWAAVACLSALQVQKPSV